MRQRAEGRCEYCRLPDFFDEWPFHVDHVVSRQHGGDDAMDNLCWACSRCNLNKGPNLSSMDPPATAPIPLFHPRCNQWDEHFQVETGRIIGLTASGRATVRLLGMNASSHIELRLRLIELGKL